MRVPKNGGGAGPGLWLFEKEESLQSKRRPNGRRDLVLFRDPLVFVPRDRLPFGEGRVGRLSSVRFSFQGPRGASAPSFKARGDRVVAHQAVVKRPTASR
jgi:hypothetical protein